MQLASVISDGNPSYTWSTDSGNLATNGGPIVEITEPGLYTLLVSDGTCSDETSIQIEPDGSFDNTIQLDAEQLGCANSMVTINAIITGNYESISWSGPGISDPSILEPTIDQPGSYTLTVSSMNPACPDVSNSIVIDQSNDAIEPIFSNYDILDCNESVLIQVLNQIGAEESAWLNESGDTLSRNEAISINSPGNYTFEYIDEFGCFGTKTIEVLSSYEEVEVSFTIDSLSCGDHEGQIFTDVDGLVESYFWQGPDFLFSSSPNPEITVPGDYRSTIKLVNGCTVYDTVTVEYNSEAFNMGMSFPTIKCNDRDVNIRTLPGGTEFEYSWTSKENEFDILGTDDNLDVDAGGSYFVDITRPSDGCTIRQWTFVQVDTIPARISFSQEKIDCDSPSIIIESDANNYTFESFEWFGPGISAANNFEKEPEVDVIGEYYIIGVNSQGCDFSDTVQIEIDTLPINLNNIPQFTLDCFVNDASVLAVADRDGSFTWTTPSGEELGPIVDNRAGIEINEVGIYIVDIVGTNGCSDQTTIDVVYGMAPPEVNFSPFTDISCENPEVTLTANLGGDTSGFSWSHDGSISAEEIVITDAGEYILTAFNTAGCMATDTALIESTYREVDISLAGDTITCMNTQIVISSESIEPTNIDYAWTGPNGETNDMQDFSITEGGMYFLEVTAEDQCVGLDSIFIESDTSRLAFDLLPIGEINCMDSIVLSDIDPMLTDTFEVSTIRWILNGNIEVEGLHGMLNTGGIYTVEVEAANGCVSEQMVEVFENKIFPEVSLSADTINCINTLSTIETEAIANDPSYLWEGPDAAIVGLTTSEIMPSAAGIYILTITDDNACSTVEEIEVIGDFEVEEPLIDQLVLTCDDPEGIITISNFDPLLTSIIVNDPSGTELADLTAPVSVPGEYELIATGLNGCTEEIAFDVFGDLSPPMVTIDSTNINCVNEDAEICISSFDNIKSYNWFLDGALILEDGDCLSTDLPGPYMSVVQGLNGCRDSFFINIEIDTISPIIELAQIGMIGCDIVEAKIDGSSSVGSDLSFTWSSDSGGIVSGELDEVLTIGSPGVYSLELLDNENGCSSSQEYEVFDDSSVLSNLQVDMMAPPCQGQDLGELNVANIEGGIMPYSYSLDDGLSFQEEALFQNLAAGEYNLIVKDSIGCLEESMVVVDEGREISLDLGEDVKILLGETYTIDPISNYDISELNVTWESTETDFTCEGCWVTEVMPLNTTIYTVYIEDDFNCSTEDRIIVQVDETTPVFIPNIFNPDGIDEDNFVVFNAGPGVQNVLSWIIVDRWGNRIFKNEDFLPNTLDNAWDGTVDGINVQPGVYMYLAQVVLINGDIRTVAGDITIIK